GRVDEKADAMRADERHDDQRLAELLHEGRHISAVASKVESRGAEEIAVGVIAADGGDEARADHGDDDADRHELVAVEHDERGEKREHGQDADDDVEQQREQAHRGHASYRILSDTITSSPARLPPRKPIA